MPLNDECKWRRVKGNMCEREIDQLRETAKNFNLGTDFVELDSFFPNCTTISYELPPQEAKYFVYCPYCGGRVLWIDWNKDDA